jgi:non-canonical (house-cleaning) NTP pyrophosphatase
MTSSNQTILVVVGSKNPVKIESCKRAFTQVFHGAEFTFEGVNAASGVSDQPMTDSETRAGSNNRASNAAAAWAAAHPDRPATYAVGLEGGCADEDVTGVGKEGLTDRSKVPLTCFAWMTVLEVWSICSSVDEAPFSYAASLVQVATGKRGQARTGSFQLPPAVAALVRGGTELGLADDAVFGRTNSKVSGWVGGCGTETCTVPVCQCVMPRLACGKVPPSRV